MDLLIIFGLALLLTVVFVYVLGSRGPWGSGWTIFFVLLFAIWSTAIWVDPIGPVYYNVAWLPITIVGLVFFILLLSVTPKRPREGLTVEEKEKEEAVAAGGVMLFFWIFLVVMAAIVAIGYFV